MAIAGMACVTWVRTEHRFSPPDTVKKNPHPKLYDDVTDNEIEGGFDAARRAFAAEFLASYLAELTALDPRSTTAPTSGNDLIAGVGANFHGRFNRSPAFLKGAVKIRKIWQRP